MLRGTWELKKTVNLNRLGALLADYLGWRKRKAGRFVCGSVARVSRLVPEGYDGWSKNRGLCSEFGVCSQWVCFRGLSLGGMGGGDLGNRTYCPALFVDVGFDSEASCGC